MPKILWRIPAVSTLYFDILTDNVDDMLAVAGLSNWSSPPDVHTYFEQLVDDNMITLP